MVEAFVFPALVLGALSLLVLILVRLRRECGRALGATSRRDRALLLLVLALALLVRASGPWAHAVYMDEWSYLEGARTLLVTGRHETCRDGVAPRCSVRADPSDPAGFPTLVAAAFALGGVGARTAMAFSLALSVVGVGLTYLLSRLLIGRADAALASALVMALLPLHVRHSTSAGTSAASLTLVLLAACLRALHAGRPQRATLAATLLASFLAASTRPENIIGLPLVLFALPQGRALRLSLSAPAFAAAVLAVLVPATERFDDAHAENWEFSLANVATKSTYLAFWAGSARWGTPLFHTPLLPLLALLGAWELRGRGRRALAFLGAWFGLFMAVYLTYVLSASYRFMLACYPPVVLLAGLGAVLVARWARLGPSTSAALSAALAAAAVAPALPSGFEPSDQHRTFQPEVEFLRRSASLLPADCAVVSFNPFVVNFELGRPALSIHLRDIALTRVAQGRCLALLEGSFCSWKANLSARSEACEFYHEEFELETVASGENPRTGTPLRLSILKPKGAAG